MGRTKAIVPQTITPDHFRCTRCGKMYKDAKGHFYMSRNSDLYQANSHYSHICYSCVNDYFEIMKEIHQDERTALILTCSIVGCYFSDELYENLKSNGDLQFGNYIRALNGRQYVSRNFSSFLLEILNRRGSMADDPEDYSKTKESKWSSSDLKNKEFVLHAVGYDCFQDSSYTNNDRKFLFNTLADYLTDDVVEDPHKVQCVISMVKTTLQVDNIDKLINAQMNSTFPDPLKIGKLSETKSKLMSSINSTAKENAISAITSGKNQKGANTLSSIMKEMSDNGFEEIKVNIVPVKLALSYQEISRDNAKALFDELNLTQDDYARLLADQSKILAELQEENMRIQEDLRLLHLREKKAGAE